MILDPLVKIMFFLDQHFKHASIRPSLGIAPLLFCVSESKGQLSLDIYMYTFHKRLILAREKLLICCC